MSNLVSNLFNEIVNVFEPFWASIVNSIIHNKTSCLNEKNKPQDIHWLNFWSKEIEENINLSRIDELKKKYPQLKYSSGLLKLQPIAINLEIAEDINYKKEVEAELLK